MPDQETPAPPISLALQIACVRRELDMRKRVYPRQITAGRMTTFEASNEIDAMSAVLRTLQELAGEPADLFPEHHGASDNGRSAQPG